MISAHQPKHASNAAIHLAGDRVLACIDDGPGGGVAARVAAGKRILALAGAGPCPVVIVPRDLGLFPAGNGPIVCGIDGSVSSLAATAVAIGLAASFGTRLHCVQVDDDDPARRLAAIATRERALAIVVGARGQGAAAWALLGSTSSRLAATASRPVVIVPSPAVTC